MVPNICANPNHHHDDSAIEYERAMGYHPVCPWWGHFLFQNEIERSRPWLVGGLEHFFPYIGNNNSNWLIFFRGVETTNQLIVWRIFGNLSIWRFSTDPEFSAIQATRFPFGSNQQRISSANETVKVDLRHTKQELNGCYWDNQLVSGRLMAKVTFLSLCCSVPSH